MLFAGVGLAPTVYMTMLIVPLLNQSVDKTDYGSYLPFFAFKKILHCILWTKLMWPESRASTFNPQPIIENTSVPVSPSGLSIPEELKTEARSSKITSSGGSTVANVQGLKSWPQIYDDYSSVGLPPSSCEIARSLSPRLLPSSHNAFPFPKAEQRWQTCQNLLGIFHCFSPHIKQYDILYLETKGALSLPAPDMRTYLLEAYVRYIHLQMPIIELREAQVTLQASIDPGRLMVTKKMSLLVFQAIMLAALPYVGLQSLQNAGYSSRETAHDELSSRVKVY
jgi:hypothetical protein